MKLVEILARELDKWPEDGGPVASIVQDPDGFAYVRCNDDSDEFSFSQGEWIGVWSNPETRKLHIDLSEDHATAIVTREMWQAERANMNAAAAITGKPGKKANADGWVRHRGGKCPVEAGTLVDVRYRGAQPGVDGYSPNGKKADQYDWRHDSDRGDIMAYRIHKPADPVQVVSAAFTETAKAISEAADAVDEFNDLIAGPIQWRDRIREIDRTVEALEEERVSLIQRLECEGLQLLPAKVCVPAHNADDWQVSAVTEGKFIQAIKQHRNLYGSGLKEAKEAVEQYRSANAPSA